MLFYVVDFLGMVGEGDGTLSLTYNGLGLACLLLFWGWWRRESVLYHFLILSSQRVVNDWGGGCLSKSIMGREKEYANNINL